MSESAKGVLVLDGDPNKAILAIAKTMQAQNEMFRSMNKQLQDANREGKSFTDGMVSGLESMLLRYGSIAALGGFIMSAASAQKEFSKEVLNTVAGLDEQIRKSMFLQGITGKTPGQVGKELTGPALAAGVDLGTAAQVAGRTGLTGDALTQALFYQRAGGRADAAFMNYLGARNIPLTAEGIGGVLGMGKRAFGRDFAEHMPELVATGAVSQEVGIDLGEEMRLADLANKLLGPGAVRGLRGFETEVGQFKRPGETFDAAVARMSRLSRRQVGKLFGERNAPFAAAAIRGWGEIQNAPGGEGQPYEEWAEATRAFGGGPAAAEAQIKTMEQGAVLARPGLGQGALINQYGEMMMKREGWGGGLQFLFRQIERFRWLMEGNWAREPGAQLPSFATPEDRETIRRLAAELRHNSDATSENTRSTASSPIRP